MLKYHFCYSFMLSLPWHPKSLALFQFPITLPLLLSLSRISRSTQKSNHSSKFLPFLNSRPHNVNTQLCQEYVQHAILHAANNAWCLWESSDGLVDVKAVQGHEFFGGCAHIRVLSSRYGVVFSK